MGLTTFDEALAILRMNIVPVRETDVRPIDQSIGCVLAEPIFAHRGNPAFDNSAVDGYLLGVPSARAGSWFQLAGEIRAGTRPPYPIPTSGQAIRIFTGAPVPPGEFCVAMQEDVSIQEEGVVLREDVSVAAGIRRAGSDFPAETELVKAGIRMGPAEIALAAWNGLSSLSVHRQLRLAVSVTGDELLEIGKPPAEGQIYDSNGPMLEALVHSAGAASVSRTRLPDDFEQTLAHLSALAHSQTSVDLAIISGGASVGDYDYLPRAVESLGEVLLYRVAIKPGKPVLFGRIGDMLLFALPGNPASSYVTFELFVREAIMRLSGVVSPSSLWIPARFDGRHGPATRDEFVRVRFETREGNLWAIPVFEQGSFGIRSLAAAQGLARLSADKPYISGDLADCLVLSA